MNKEIPPAIKIAIELMKKSFGGTDIEIISDAYRLSPSEDAPAGALGCDIHIKIPEYDMIPVKMFLRNSISEDIAWWNIMGGAPDLGQMVADEIVFTCLKPEYEKLKEN